jgi:ATP-dependent helicase Lhr and Lhr-like helicase
MTMSTLDSDASALAWAHPLVRDWFAGRFGDATEPQALGWPSIRAGRATLISAPTGSGKTLAAFLFCIDRLVRKALAGALEDRTEVVYVSPLKALGNDIHRNLEAPLGEIQTLARTRGLEMPAIRAAVRTGDTLAHERRAMLAHPPHILVTTPESLYILLTAERSRETLRGVETVIVDEIHAVADDKRGAHLSLSLERLDALARRPPQRIGLSATQRPIELVGSFLAGAGRPAPAIVQIGHQRQVDIAVETPPQALGPVATHEIWDDVYARLAALAGQHRSTLVFVNTRRMAERLAHQLAERLGADAVAAHHGSLSRRLRLEAEERLKAGRIRVLVATASLELGIDIGSVDLVCLIGSPRSISVAWQRVGRAGHWHGAIPRGRFFPTTRDELVECAALVRAMRAGDLDRLAVCEEPLDILAQHVVAACAADDWLEDDLFALVRRAHPYRRLTRERFDEIVSMLAEGISVRRGRYGTYLHHDRVNRRLRGRRGARLAAITGGGAIPDAALYTVVAEPEGVVVGTVDEDFAVESMRGDIMLLGNTSWRIRRVQAGKVLVEDARGAPPNIPFWLGEAPARTLELSAQVADLRAAIDRMTAGLDPSPALWEAPGAQEALAWLQREAGLDSGGAKDVVSYIVEGRAVLGVVPTMETVVAERFFDEGGGMQLVVHAPFGGRINKAWGLALRKRFCRSFNLELQAAATDNGLNISLAEQHSFPLADVFNFLSPASVARVLEQAVLASPIFGARWRWDASRALVLLRFQGGRRVPPNIQRMRADDLLAAVFPDAAACPENLEGDLRIPDHPLVREVMRDALTEALDVEGLKDVLARIGEGRIRVVAANTTTPSAFSHEILNANPFAYLDDAPLEERRARAVEMRRILPESVLEDVGRLDPEAITEVRAQAWPDVRNADELHDALVSLVALPEIPALGASVDRWGGCFAELVAARRATRAAVDTRSYWVPAERARTFTRLFPLARFDRDLPPVESVDPPPGDARLALVTGWMQHVGPTSAPALADLTGLPAEEVEAILLRLEGMGTVLRGRFSGAAPHADREWCDRRLLARIHRLTIGRLRREIEPVTAAAFMRWLFEWQHVAPGSQLVGAGGLVRVIAQLQGFEAPASAWEGQILARRVSGYDPELLDRVCLDGSIGWGRLSPHPATLDDARERERRVVPTSSAPVAFFVREDADWLPAGPAESDRVLGPAAREVLDVLGRRGALFFAEIARATGRLKAEVEGALWELVAAGLVTADGFDNLRALIDPKRRAGRGHGRSARPRHSAGRWALLRVDPPRGGHSAAVEAACRVLVARYGVVFREVLARESAVPRWRELVAALRRLEDRGELRGGRFVAGFAGEQFALPSAVESLRAARREAQTGGQTVTVSAADPLNLSGIVVPGERVAPISGRVVTFRDGAAVVPSGGHAALSVSA